VLESLKVWAALPADTRTPVYDMRIDGDAGAASALHFSAWQQQVRELAWIVDAAALEAELASALRYAPHVVPGVEPASAALVVVARQGLGTREQFGVTFERHDYGNVRSRRAARERAPPGQHGSGSAPPTCWRCCHRPAATRHGLALVWSLRGARGCAAGAGRCGLRGRADAATAGAAGELRLASARAAWPLALARAERVCGPAGC